MTGSLTGNSFGDLFGSMANRGSGRTQSGAVGRPEPLLSPHRQKVLWAGGAITLLAMATILPTQVSSQAIAEANCEQVIKSGAEISRGQMASLMAVPGGATRESVQQVITEPYCTLPAIALPMASAIAPEAQLDSQLDSQLDNQPASREKERTTAQPAEPMLERDAYPLAFDPEAWLVVTYREGAYQGVDFAFKPRF
ncbi:MAG: hypothetical protein AAFN12_03400 [Cyanobacteria bacterium J06560_2]